MRQSLTKLLVRNPGGRSVPAWRLGARLCKFLNMRKRIIFALLAGLWLMCVAYVAVQEYGAAQADQFSMMSEEN